MKIKYKQAKIKVNQKHSYRIEQCSNILNGLNAKGKETEVQQRNINQRQRKTAGLSMKV